MSRDGRARLNTKLSFNSKRKGPSSFLAYFRYLFGFCFTN